MSKQVKQLEMDALKATFQGVRDLLLLGASGLDAQTDNQLRLHLRKKHIRLKVVKNSLARRVFEEMGLRVTSYWEGPTLLAWGAGSLAELSREFDTELRRNVQLKNKLKVKGAVADGQEVTFEQALKMPTRTEAIARVVNLALSPASRLVAQFLAPATRVAAQVKTLGEKAPEGPPPAGAAAPPGQA
jgi:large subunit ribosomal protein L10